MAPTAKTRKTAAKTVSKRKTGAAATKSVAASGKKTTAGASASSASVRKKTTKPAGKTSGEAKKAVPPRSGKTLVVVESPTKAKTLTNILGSGYVVKASVGHIVDLPKSRLAIDIENGFKPEYILVKGKAPVKKELQTAAAAAKKVLLAADPDREGEAIAWHVAGLLGVDPADDCRVRFHEITAEAVRSAVKEPTPIDMDRVDAQ